jgi:hypothetical protein
MADNSSVGGVNYATDDIGGVHWQRVKATFGADGSATDVSPANPLPVNRADTTVTGTITATDAVLGVHAGAGVPLTGTPTAGSYVAYPVNGEGGFSLRLSGTFGGGTVWMESSPDSTDGINGGWTTNLVRQSGISTTFIDADITAAGIFRGTAAGYSYLRVRVTGATAPSITATFRGSMAPSVTAQVASLPTGANTIGVVIDKKDSARTSVSLYATAVTAGTSGTEALVTLTIARGVAATTTGTTFAITAGKTFRITGIRFRHVAGAATANSAVWRLRVNTAGAALVTSTPITITASTRAAATAAASDVYDIPIGEGYEITNASGTTNIALTVTPTWTTTALTYDAHIIGYEY